MKQKLRLVLFLILSTSLLSPPALSDVRIASFNIKNWGWNTGKDNASVAQILNRFDLIAIQEVMDPEEPALMVKHLTEMTGEPWQEMTSHLIGRSSYKEAYTFLWRESAIEYVDGAVVYLDNRDTFAREPFSARFRSKKTGTTFAMGTVHVLYGDSIQHRLPEILAMVSYWEWLGEIYPDTPRILAGDFNLPPDHEGWDQLLEAGARPAISEGATTLSTTNGRFANLYDNLWLAPGKLDVEQVGIFRFPQTFGISHEKARAEISDHAPVYLTLGNATVDVSPFKGHSPTAVVAQPACIDINTASLEVLEGLPHIGPARAKEIVRDRPWVTIDTLTKISGIGKSRLEDIKDYPQLCS